MKNNNLWIIILVLILIVGAFFFGKCSQTPVIKKEIKYDTTEVIKIKQGPQINLDSLKASLIRYRDKLVEVIVEVPSGDSTITDTIKVMPFVAHLDTIINRDTIGIRYLYPENYFGLVVRTKDDTLRSQIIKVLETITVEKSESWYIKPLIFAGGGFLGYIGGRIQK